MQPGFSACFLLWTGPDFQELLDSTGLVQTQILNRPHRQPRKAGGRKRREVASVWSQRPICSIEGVGSKNDQILLGSSPFRGLALYFLDLGN